MRVRAMLVGGLAVAMLPLGPASGQTPPPAEQLGSTRDDLELAQGDLARIEAELREVQAELMATDARLAAASAELHQIERDLEAAEAARAAAAQREREATVALRAANARVEVRVSAWEANQERLDARAADVYKRGRASTGGLLLGGIVSASGLHEVTVTVRTVQGLLERDRQLLERNQELAATAARARSGVALARAAAVREHATVAEEQERIEVLAGRQRRAVEEIGQERARRAAVLRSIEADRVKAAVLVKHLERRMRELAQQLAAALLAETADIPFDGPMPDWASGLPAAGQRWAPAINAAAASVGLDGRLLAALVWTESNFTPTAVSHAGAIGLAQLMPTTAAGLGVDPWDPLQNLSGGARYLRAMIARFGSVELGLAAYNAGPGRVERAGNRVPDIVETQLYVLRVLERYAALVG